MLIVEGYLDLISLFQSGIEHVVATQAALTRSHVQLLKAYAKEAVPGIRRRYGRTIRRIAREGIFSPGACALFPASAHVSSLQGALEGDLHAKVVLLPQGHDPDTFVQAEGRDALLAKVREAQPFIEFLLDAEAEGHDLASVQGKLAWCVSCCH